MSKTKPVADVLAAAQAGQQDFGENQLQDALSNDLKKRGWTYVGPTTVYAFMQAMGMVNDHVPGCATRSRVDRSRRRAASR